MLKAPKNEALVYIILILAIGAGLGYYLKSGGLPFADESTMSLALTVHYEDGSMKVIDPTTRSVLPEKIAILDDTGKAISSIDFEVKVKVSYEGTAVSSDIRGTTDIFINNVKQANPSFSRGGVRPSGEWVTVQTGSLDQSFFEDRSNEGENQLRILSPVTVTMTFSDGATDQLKGAGGVVMTYKLDSAAQPAGGQITALQVQVTPSLLY